MNTDRTYAEKIAEEYAPKETRKVVALRKLDQRAKQPAYIFAYTFGVMTALLFGVGMCLCLGVIGGGTTLYMILGVAVGTAGLIGVTVNYPLFRKILTRSMDRYAPDILALAGEIAKEQE